jgi:hypothetical protein
VRLLLYITAHALYKSYTQHRIIFLAFVFALTIAYSYYKHKQAATNNACTVRKQMHNTLHSSLHKARSKHDGPHVVRLLHAARSKHD